MPKASHKIKSKQILNTLVWDNINQFCSHKSIKELELIIDWIKSEFKIDITMDSDVVNGYIKDWSNIQGEAIGLCRPKNTFEAIILVRVFFLIKIPYTISAGRTNLTGSATPMGGFVLSIENLNNIQPTVKDEKVVTSAGIYLEDMRNMVLQQTNNKFYYPVDPTSRKEAMVGGTISCNASGFVPGQEGATRYWVDKLKFILPNGHIIDGSRGQNISDQFTFELDDELLSLPKYNRPKIKNASGPYTCGDGEMDFIDLIIGSEGIFGLVTECTFNLKENPKDYLNLFIILKSEALALKFYHYISEALDYNLNKITALEYFGYNCQNYMVNKEHFFKNKNEVGIYCQIPLYNTSINEACENWLDILLSSDCGLTDDKIYVLNDQHSWNLFFESRHSMPDLALKKTKELDGISIITDTIVPPKNFNLFLEKVHCLIKDANIEYLLFGHLGDCHLHFHLIIDKHQEEEAINVYDKIIDISSSLNGVYSAEHGTGKRKKIDFIKCYGNTAAEQIRTTKLFFDPNMLLNKGNVIS